MYKFGCFILKISFWNGACLFWAFNLGVNFFQFYPQRELNPKVGSLHQISDRNFDQKLTQLSRVQNESYHLVHLWVNDVQIFGVWSPPYLRPILQDLFEFFEHAKNISIFQKFGATPRKKNKMTVTRGQNGRYISAK